MLDICWAEEVILLFTKVMSSLMISFGSLIGTIFHKMNKTAMTKAILDMNSFNPLSPNSD